MHVSLTDDITRQIFVEDHPQKADVIFVPGNGYPQMAERAAELFREGWAPYVLPSGRCSVTVGKFTGVLEKQDVYAGDYRTEFDFLKDVLVKNGVPVEAILREDRAGYTYENALFSKEAAERAHVNVERAILCCKNYHAKRALLYYQTVFPETEFFVCPSCVDGITRDNWFCTEQGIEEVLKEVHRIIRQFSLLM
ncbi:MAG: YdcF family protein [Blautia sp.]|nr:YdcF family protein [Blautia sp.]